MKRIITYSLFFFLTFFIWQIRAFSQTSGDCNCDCTPTTGNTYNGGAYRTALTGSEFTEPNGFVLWEEATWQKWNGNAWVNSTPPLRNAPKVSNVCIAIQNGHKILSKESVRYKTHFNLKVCGSLVFTPGEELYVPSIVPDVELVSAVPNGSGVTFTGRILLSYDPLAQEGVPVEEAGFLIYPGVYNPDLPISSYYAFPVFQNQSIIVSPNEDPYPFSITINGGDFQVAGETQYVVLAYAINENGVGISSSPYSFTYSKSGNKYFQKFADKYSLSGFTQSTLTICETGYFSVDNLYVGPQTNFQIEGILVADSILNGGNGNGNVPGFCLAGGGTVVSSSGGQTIFGNGITNTCDFEGVLPIELLSFTPSIKPDRVELNWTTGSEINNDYFTLERSRDLYGWEVLGFVEGAGNSSTPLSYSYSDLRPLDGLSYYRLKQTDFDGAFKYYGPIAAHYDLGLDGLDFKVLKQYTNWVIAVPKDGIYQVEVYNLQGHRLHSERVENTLSIPAPQGAVVIRVTDGFERSASRVVM